MGVRGTQTVTRRGGDADAASARDSRLLERARHAGDPKQRHAAALELCDLYGGLAAAAAARAATPGSDPEVLLWAAYLGLRLAIARPDPLCQARPFAAHAADCMAEALRGQTGGHGVRTPWRATASYRQFARFGARLMADAQGAGAREGAPVSPMDSLRRAARRCGLPAAIGGLILAEARRTPHGPEDERVARLDRVRARRRLVVLVETILGRREKAVFLARCMTGNAAAVPAAKLARVLGVEPCRIAVLEASARRKIATAVCLANAEL